MILEEAVARLKANEDTMTVLSLANQFLEDEDGRVIAEALKTNHTLISLDLSHNCCLGEASRDIAEALEVNSTLSLLDMSYNELGDIDGKAIAGAIEKNYGLNSLRLCSNELSEISGEALAKALKANCTLVSLDLSGNYINDISGRKLAEALKENRILTSFNLSSNNLAEFTAQAFCEALMENLTLTSLNLSGNQINAVAFLAIQQAIEDNLAGAKKLQMAAKEGNLAKVEMLVLKGVSLNYQDEEGNTAAHIAAIEEHEEVLEFLLRQDYQLQLRNKSNKFPEEIMEQKQAEKKAKEQQIAVAVSEIKTLYKEEFYILVLAECEKLLTIAPENEQLMFLQTLAKLHLNDPSIIRLRVVIENSEEAQMLAEALKENHRLTALELSIAGLGETEGEIVAKTLAVNQALTWFKLNNLNLDFLWENSLNRFELPIIKALHANNVLAYLDLSNNALSDAEGIAIAEALKVNNTLTSLNISHNELGEVAGYAIANALEENATLASLDLSYNELDWTAGEALVHALKMNFTLISLNLKANNLGNTILSIIEDEVQENLANAKKLQSAAKQGNFEQVKERVLQKASLNYQDEEGNTALHLAAEEGHVKIANFLLLRKNQLRLKNNNNEYPMDILKHKAQADQKIKLVNIKKLYKEGHYQAVLNQCNNIFNQVPWDSELIALQAGARILTNEPNIHLFDLSQRGLDDVTGKIIAEALKANHSLVSIDLSNNALGETSGQALAETLALNDSLTSINLSNNALGEISGQALAEALSQNRSLNLINLNNNVLGKISGLAFAEALKRNCSLNSIDLSSNALGDISGLAFAEALKVNRNLTSIDLSNTMLDETSSEALAQALKVNRTLTSLCLRLNQLSEDNAQAFIEALEENYSLVFLDLRFNGLSEASLALIEQAIQNNLTNAIKLQTAVKSNDLNEVFQLVSQGVSLNYQDEDGNTALHLAAQECHEVIMEFLLQEKEQLLLKNRYNDYPKEIYERKQAERKAKEQQEAKRKAKLKEEAVENIKKLNQDKLFQKALAECAKLLEEDPKNSQLLFLQAIAQMQSTELDLSNSELDDINGQAIAEALKFNCTVSVINLSRNRIGEIGGLAIAEALMHNRTLLEIDLSDNELGETSSQVIAEALKVNHTLISLKLGDNKFGELGGLAIAEALKKNKTLTSLYFYNNNLDATSGQALVEALKENHSLTLLNIDNNTALGSNNFRLIKEKIQKNIEMARTLQAVVKKGDFDAVKKCVSQGVSLNYQDDKGNTALHLAAAEGYNKIVNFLIKEKGQLKLKNKKGELPKGCEENELVYSSNKISYEKIKKDMEQQHFPQEPNKKLKDKTFASDLKQKEKTKHELRQVAPIRYAGSSSDSKKAELPKCHFFNGGHGFCLYGDRCFFSHVVEENKMSDSYNKS